MQPTADDVVLHMRDVTLRRGRTHILTGIDWQVRAGERWVILGPNGAGKSTLVQIAATRLHPTSGEVQILGETLGLTDVFALRPLIGLAGAGLAGVIPPREAVIDVVVTASWGVTGRWREAYDDLDVERARDLATRWGLGALLDRTFGTLSEGERKRAQIARALMADPELLLLDEPAAGLDLGGREDLVGRLGAMALDPYAPVTVLVTHHVEEIPVGTTHALLLRGGAVVDAGPISTVVTGEKLTDTYGLPIDVAQHEGRWTARARAIGANPT